MRVGQHCQHTNHRTDGTERALAGVIGVGAVDQIVLDLEPDAIRAHTSGQDDALSYVDFVPQVRANGRHQLPLVERHRSSLDAEHWASRCGSRGRRNVVAIGEVAALVILELQLRAGGHTLFDAEQTVREAAAQTNSGD
jgi:hypothetical protein